jgi:hypothetical protein
MFSPPLFRTDRPERMRGESMDTNGQSNAMAGSACGPGSTRCGGAHGLLLSYLRGTFGLDCLSLGNHGVLHLKPGIASTTELLEAIPFSTTGHMIVLNLSCSGGHRFEGWFASADAFAAQSEQGQVACPVCNDAEIMRLPAAPRVRRFAAETAPVVAQQDRGLQAMAQDLARLIADADDVGDKFPEEARRIHYREVPERAIRGQATLHETHALLEEGIAVLPLPGKKDSLN